MEQVIKDQKLLDAYAIIESYCEVVLERIKQLEHERLANEDVNCIQPLVSLFPFELTYDFILGLILNM